MSQGAVGDGLEEQGAVLAALFGDRGAFVDSISTRGYASPTNGCGVEQLAARRAHNPEVAGSSPAPAIRGK